MTLNALPPAIDRRRPTPHQLSLHARLDAQLRLAGAGSWEALAETGALSLSEQAERLLLDGRSPTLEAPRSIRELAALCCGIEQPAFDRALERSMSEGASLDFQARIELLSGETRHLDFHAQALVDEVGSRRLCGVILDVTERCQLRQQIELSHALMSIGGRAARLGGWSLDASSNSVIFSDQARSLFELDTDAPLTLGRALELYDPSEREAAERETCLCLTRGAPFDSERLARSASGRSFWVRVIGEPVFGPQGAIERVQGAFQDISARRKNELDSRELSDRLAQILDSVQDGFFTIDPQRRVSYMNKQTEIALGASRESSMGQPWLAAFKEAGPGQLQSVIERSEREQQSVEAECFIPSTGRWLSARAHPSPMGTAVYLRDVTELRAEREELSLLKNAIERVNDVVVIAESPLRMEDPGAMPTVVFVNQAYTRLTGRSPADVIGRPPFAITQQQAQSPEVSRMLSEARQGRGSRAELIYHNTLGLQRWLEVDVAPVPTESGVITHWVAIQRDITERKIAQDEIAQLAFHDQLTGLPNRIMLMERLKHALAESDRSGRQGALLFIDLDNFKALNDTLGHDRGDLLLQQVGQRLRELAPEPDFVARLGGDEFVVMLENLSPATLTAAAEVKEKAELIRQSLSSPYDLDGSARHSSASIGITLFQDHNRLYGELLKRADMAMYQAKSHGGNALRFFDPQMQAALSARDALESELREGLRLEEFELLYQPQVDSKGELVGAEALSRWRRGDRAPSPPTQFIPLAEETGLIIPLGQWALRQACERLALWSRSEATRSLSMSVNVSAREFRRPEFVEQTLAVIDASGANPRLLKLELTESILVDDMETAIAKMKQLGSRGVRFSLDDFGTGYSSLAYLKLLPLTQIKIDQSFVRDALKEPADAAIARAIISLCQSLGLEALAEGVESQEQLNFLESSGCGSYQGFLFGKAMSAELFQTMAERYFDLPNEHSVSGEGPVAPSSQRSPTAQREGL